MQWLPRNPRLFFAGRSRAALQRWVPRNHSGSEHVISTLPLKKKLEDLIHTLRLHQRLIEAGLGNEPDLPLGVILLADLADPILVSRLYPVLDTLKELLAHIPNSYSYLLLKTAVFESNPEDRVAFARLHLHLQKLQVQADQPNWPFQVYLFDRYKEGIWEVKDDDELNVLMGNFLLALLSGRFAQQIAQRFSLLDARDLKRILTVQEFLPWFMIRFICKIFVPSDWRGKHWKQNF